MKVACERCGAEHECTKLSTQQRARVAAQKRWAGRKPFIEELAEGWIQKATKAKLGAAPKPNLKGLCPHGKEYQRCTMGVCRALVEE